MSGKYIVRMTVKEREKLEKLVRTGKRAAVMLLHARILLKADVGAMEGGWPDERTAQALDTSLSMI